ncbi:MAG TPA: hypothetical protein VG323_06075, partial [Thermoanaerobaculia bacterium]|nr:hypothetical protein [Thermoanaerobaculia bacterium]
MIMLLLSTSAFAAPKFAGEIWAGSEVIPGGGPVNVYWVFDGGVFHEYVYYYATDEIRPLTSGRYTVCESQGKTAYTLNFPVSVRVPTGPKTDDQAGTFVVQTKIVQVPFTKADGFLSSPRGDRLTSVGSFTQYVPPIDHPASVSGKLKPSPNFYASCCSDCYAVHDFFGISSLN